MAQFKPVDKIHYTRRKKEIYVLLTECKVSEQIKYMQINI